MEDDFHKSGIYRWKRQTKPRVHSRSQKVATTDDIQDWLQKVEAASSKAAEAVLGTEFSSPYSTGRQRGRATVKGLSDHARIQDEAYTEAQDLLNEWITQKVSYHDDDLEDDPDLGDRDPWRKEELGSKARREWDNLLNGNLEELGTDPTPRFRPAQEEDDPYANLYDLDDDEAVSTVLKNMMGKELVKENFRKDLGFDDSSKAHDPRTKMMLRHQQVKENRMKREEELKRKRKEAESKKEARMTAQQMVNKEEKHKEMRRKREEQEMRKQMAQIRKEMQDARKQESEERLKRDQEEEEKARLAREEFERQQAVERAEMLRRQHEISEKRKAQLTQRELEKARQAANNLRILHRHFTAWYDIVLYHRLGFGKARALADWRLTLRVWNAWRSYARSQRITVETKQHEQNVVEENRKSAMAKKHHYLKQLRRHFSAWRDFVSQEQDRRHLERAQETTRSKMMNLLSAVADGTLWSAREEEENTEERPSGGGRGSARNHGREKGAAASAQNVKNELDAMFSQPSRRIAWEEESDTSPLSSSRPQSSLSSASTAKVSGQGRRTPSQAWQITRKHAQLSKKELVKFIRGETDPEEEEELEAQSEHSDTKIRRRFGTQPWMNRQYTVNNFEHRFTAQQKLLREQQTAIKEQKRMIQDLMFTQQQQDHQNRVAELSPDKQPSLQGDAVSVPQTGSGDESRLRDKTRTSGVRSPQVPVTAAQRNLSDDGDTHRSELSTTRSDKTGSEVTTTSAATSNTQNNTKYLQVLKNMEDRAAERARLKAEREEKRRKAEDERLERLKAEEEDLKKKAEEEKQARVQAFREKKRLEKQKEQEKQRELELQRELTAKADNHYQKALMKFRVLVPMKKLVQMAHEEMDRARQHHNHQILRKVLGAWKTHTDELTAEKKQLADDLHGYIVVRRCFHGWKNFKYRMVFLERRAERHHRELILPKLFEAWRQFTAQEKLVEQERLRIAQDFYPRSLQKKVFHAWRRLPQELRREVEREKLRAEMRKKVADLLPDFKPSTSVTQSADSTT